MTNDPTRASAPPPVGASRRPKPILHSSIFTLQSSIFTLQSSLILLLLCSTALADTAPGSTARATVLFFNDLHGRLQPFPDTHGDTVGGIARIATLVRRIRAENNAQGIPTFLLVAGDIFQGTLLSTVFKGGVELQAANALGVDAMVVGNHEFDFGYDRFIRFRDSASFPVISANIIDRETGRRLQPSQARFPLTPSCTLVVIGVTTPELLTSTMASNVRGLAVEDPIATTRALLDSVSSGQPVILLSHDGFVLDSLAALALPRLKAVIGGHDHYLLPPDRRINGIPVAQAGSNGAVLGRLDLGVGSQNATELNYLPIVDTITPDSALTLLVAGYAGSLDKLLKQRVGRTRTLLDARRENIRSAETNLGNLVADAMRRAGKTDVALINSGGIRASLNPGPITMGSLYEVLPFDTRVIRVSLTGGELAEVLARTARIRPEDCDGGFLQVSGLRFRIRDGTPQDIQVGRAPLDPNRTYRVTTVDFLGEGGNGYTTFAGKPADTLPGTLRDVLAREIRRLSPVNARTDQRITRE